MIKLILECLKYDMPHDSEYIAIAKGKNKLPLTIKEKIKLWLKK